MIDVPVGGVRPRRGLAKGVGGAASGFRFALAGGAPKPAPRQPTTPSPKAGGATDPPLSAWS